jgi:collagenase-like PrtC family protease
MMYGSPVDRVTAELAAEMIALFGSGAGTEARARAFRSRDLGNAINYCRWRQAERFITLLSGEGVGTLH